MPTLAMIAAHAPLDRLRERILARVVTLEIEAESIAIDEIHDDATGIVAMRLVAVNAHS